MLITVLNQKYKVGCERGQSAEEVPGIFSKLNQIVEWDKCTWPEKDGTPDTEYLGKQPKLSSGDCFFFDGNVIALDREDRLILVLSETGPGALKRICDEIINTEFSLVESRGEVSDIQFSELKDTEKIPETYEEYKVPFYQMRLFHEKFSFGRIEPGTTLKCEIEHIVPIHAYITDWSIYFNTDEVDSDMFEYFTTGILSWFYSNFERNLPPKKELPDPA